MVTAADKAPLDAAIWAGLEHAYGSAADIPAMLEALSAWPVDDAVSEPWFGLWSALCHQGDVYSGSFAATPWIVERLAANPIEATDSFFHLPTQIELARRERGIEAPDELSGAYFEALRRLGDLAAVAATSTSAAASLPVTFAAIAVSRADYPLASLLIELNETNTNIILKMFENGEI